MRDNGASLSEYYDTKTRSLWSRGFMRVAVFGILVWVAWQFVGAWLAQIGAL